MRRGSQLLTRRMFGVEFEHADHPFTPNARRPTPNAMDILFLLIPLSVGLGLLILGALGWAVWRGQFDSLDAEGARILESD